MIRKIPSWSLGFSYGYHDSSVAAVSSSGNLFSSHLERFSRVKFDSEFPYSVLSWLSEEIGFESNDISSINYFEFPELKFDRQVATLLADWPKSYRLSQVIPRLLNNSRKTKELEIREAFTRINGKKLSLPKLKFWSHHESHAASAFLLSPYEKSISLVLDAVGESQSTSIWLGNRNALKPLTLVSAQDFPDSYGIFYSMMTLYCGFKINTGEYKLMGLAPYGNPVYQDKIEEDFFHLSGSGFVTLERSFLDFIRVPSMHSAGLVKLFNQPPRKFGDKLTQFHADVAASTQAVIEKGILRLVHHSRESLGRNLPICLAGGVALNAVANGRLSERFGNDNVFIPPAAGDAGGAMGSALLGWWNNTDSEDAKRNLKLNSARIGKRYTKNEVLDALKFHKIKYSEQSASQIANLLAAGKIIGWFEGREEWGPRALGGRSILADPRVRFGQVTINEKIKFRESFRPFAPVVLEEYADTYFEFSGSSPFMLKVFGVKNAKTRQSNYLSSGSEIYHEAINIRERISEVDSPIPAATHLDGSARVQTINLKESPLLYEVIDEFRKLTGTPILINTSFNVRGEPIVHSPGDALTCFFTTGLDYLFIEGLLVEKQENLNVKSSFERQTFDED